MPAAGASFLLYAVISQNFSAVQVHLKKQRVRFDRDFTLRFNQNPYINIDIFLGHFDLSLTRKESRMGFYSTR
jgi:hypothetical protein